MKSLLFALAAGFAVASVSLASAQAPGAGMGAQTPPGTTMQQPAPPSSAPMHPAAPSMAPGASQSSMAPPAAGAMTPMADAETGTASCHTHKAEGASCSCLKAPTMMGTAHAGARGRMMCMTP